jgi:hypothetical protein
MAGNYQLAELGQLLVANVSSNVITLGGVLSIGNSTVDVYVNSTAINIGNATVNNTITTDYITFGNNSQNVTINSTSVYLNGSRLLDIYEDVAFTGANSWTAAHYFSNTTPSSNANSGTITVVGGVGVYGNVYTGGVVGYSNASNVSVVYTYYNPLTNSLDTVFG